MTGLVPCGRVWRQPALDDPELGWEAVEIAAAKVNGKFGRRSVRRATLARASRGAGI